MPGDLGCLAQRSSKTTRDKLVQMEEDGGIKRFIQIGLFGAKVWLTVLRNFLYFYGAGAAGGKRVPFMSLV